MRTREEHLAWCKERALAYLADHDVRNAITSMLSDLGKHPECAGAGEKMALFGMMIIRDYSVDDARKFIEGFR